MIIDTPGHESFSNLRSRGSSLCDLSIVVIDIMRGLQPQTIESLELLKKQRGPFAIALNKVDRLRGWKRDPRRQDTCIRSALERQQEHVKTEFRERMDEICWRLKEYGLNCYLYWENEDLARYVSIIPTSARTGEGIPNLLYFILLVSQRFMHNRLQAQNELECKVVEVKTTEGFGPTIDVVLKNGTLRVGDEIVIAGIDAPLVTRIRALVTPQHMKELRVKSEYEHHQMINTTMGIKICGDDLEKAVVGSDVCVVGPEHDVEELKRMVDSRPSGLSCRRAPEGVYVMASSQGSLEGLWTLLAAGNIPVSQWAIGEVQKGDVMKASLMKKKRKEYAVMLCFDVRVNPQAQALADKEGIQIITADTIYSVVKQFTLFLDRFNAAQKQQTKDDVVFPVILKIDRQNIFNRCNPLIFGCKILEGQLRVGTPICVPEKKFLDLGRVEDIRVNGRSVKKAKQGQTVSIQINAISSQAKVEYDKHFDHRNLLFSKVSRSSIDILKEHYRDEMTDPDWHLIRRMETLFKI